MWRAMIATLLTAFAVNATAQDALRIQELRQEINELQRLVRDQSRRIDALERQLSQSKLTPSPGVSSRSAVGRAVSRARTSGSCPRPGKNCAPA